MVLMSKRDATWSFGKSCFSWPSSIAGISTTERVSTVNSKIEAIVDGIEGYCSVGAFEADVRRLCTDINRLVDYIEVTGVHCSSFTYISLLETLARLRLVVTQVRKQDVGDMFQCVFGARRPHGIQTPSLPTELSAQRVFG
ncbi:uncharacterized protein TEOVI_000207800 [Trypanosoma equiperdum]|uniref:Uncharacterized protein n=2 Tax=Trypanozoon TaxID=39700 RepID=Q57Z00_TRYB2|nr:hypothetical protein, conserved [Trypanosoma brucei brucei TREU927]AAX80599.1 hypothetical protein, conserved [Trypanosoma brucei]AAZ11560.1 hypothetical protein, conserved [Trypanosoma brucei brucei TREU927]SCU70504.1 hypothetical protein, conserved [Trypanosoma equiperdum]